MSATEGGWTHFVHRADGTREEHLIPAPGDLVFPDRLPFKTDTRTIQLFLRSADRDLRIVVYEEVSEA